jgi:hypothetical protein
MRIRDPGWKKFGSGIEKYGSGINIPDPQHCYHLNFNYPKHIKTLGILSEKDIDKDKCEQYFVLG